MTTDQEKLAPQMVARTFVSAVKARRKLVLPGKDIQQLQTEKLTDEQEKALKQFQYINDLAVVRYLSSPIDQKPYLRVINEGELTKIMDKKAKVREWRNVECVQTVVKARFGIGRCIPIEFQMLLSVEEEEKIYNLISNKATGISKEPPVLKYQYAKIGAQFQDQVLKENTKKLTKKEVQQKVELLLEEHAPEDFCYRQVLKMCFYLQTVRGIEVLSLKCEFCQDQNGQIWLSYVSDIICRPKKQSYHELTIIQNLKEAQQAKQQHQETGLQRMKFELQDSTLLAGSPYIQKSKMHHLFARRSQITFAARRPPTVNQIMHQRTKLFAVNAQMGQEVLKHKQSQSQTSFTHRARSHQAPSKSLDLGHANFENQADYWVKNELISYKSSKRPLSKATGQSMRKSDQTAWSTNGFASRKDIAQSFIGMRPNTQQANFAHFANTLNFESIH